MNKYFIGIDIGTTNIKSVLFNENYNQVFAASRANFTAQQQEGWSEQNMTMVLEKTIETLVELVQSSGVSANQIKAIGISGQGEGAWLVDKNGEPVRDAIIWSDTRASGLIDSLSEDLVQQLTDETGSPPHPGNMSMVMLWLAENEPESLNNAKYCLFAKDWIRLGLTAKANLEVSDTGTSIMSLQHSKVSNLVLEKLGLTQYRGLLPKLGQSADVVGTITARVAEATGLDPATQVVMGGVDVSCAALGLGATKQGDVFSILGTTCCTGVISEQAHVKGEGLRCIPDVIPNLYIDLIATLSGTPNLDWAIENIAASKDFSEVEKLISQVSVGSGGVWYHPYIGGERAPFMNVNARASFFGISKGTTTAHLLRAVFEGISYTIKDALQGHPHGEYIYLAGGGSNSKTWLQIIADMTGRTVIVGSDSELSAKGAAMLAGIAMGDLVDLKNEAYFNVAFKLEPIPKNVMKYEKLYQLYREFRVSVNRLWDLRTELRKDS
ncbi:FGGY-family carbohydrate kinase [Agarivorans sp. QJM3NY_29]|uniref:FGGY-family carbohydrate kinase n=1 Tax=unclassified Agarivorans TaxID=2636026 RepID=UPI003D7DBBE0